LFNLVDALVTEDRAHSLPELSLSPHFERRWGSVYEALEDGHINEKRQQEVFADFRPASSSPLRLAVDATGIARPKAVTSADRSAQLVHNLPEGETAKTYGWQFSTVVALPEQPGSWTYVLSVQRIATDLTAQQMAWTQVRELASHLPTDTIILMDRGYDSAWLWCQLSTLPVQGTLIRLKKNRCFYRPAPAPTGKRGAPRKRGEKLQPCDKTTHSDPDSTWSGSDAAGRLVHLCWWHSLTLKEAGWLKLCVIRVERPQAKRTTRELVCLDWRCQC
jgi:hypothetical protein